MKTYRLAVLVVGLALMFGTAPSWGQDPSSNDTSDANNNTGGGSGALVSNTTGISNTAYGFVALQNNSSGRKNTAFGSFALQLNTGGGGNTAVGNAALLNDTGSFNTAVGLAALQNNSTGGYNTASGYQALFHNTAGIDNTAFGTNALLSNTMGSNNTAVGFNALFSNTAANNTANGAYALSSNTIGFNNTASGYVALMTNTSGHFNTAIGFAALLNSTGSSNIAVGTSAGSSLVNGDGNTYVGVGIGSGALYSESNTMRLGNGQTRTFISGVAGVPVTGKQVFITSSGQLGIKVSSARYKRDIQDMGDRSRRLFQLRPVTFRYKHDPQGQRQYGLIAEEVAKVYPELVTKGADGKVESLQYDELIPMLLNELQSQQRELAQLKAENARLHAAAIEQNAAFAARLERLETATRTGDPGFALRLSALTNKISVKRP